MLRLFLGEKKSYAGVPSRRVMELFPHRIFYFIAIIFLTAVTDALHFFSFFSFKQQQQLLLLQCEKR